MEMEVELEAGRGCRMVWIKGSTHTHTHTALATQHTKGRFLVSLFSLERGEWMDGWMLLTGNDLID